MLTEISVTGQIALGTAQDAQDADEETGSRVIIPCGPRFNVPPLHLIRPNNMRRCVHPSSLPWSNLTLYHRFASWIDQLPLATVQRVHHITHGDSHYRFHEHQDALDDDVFQYFTWSGGSMDGTLRTSLVVAVQPVWAVEEVVLHVMSNADTVSPLLIATESLSHSAQYSMPASPTEAGALTPPNQLWAKVNKVPDTHLSTVLMHMSIALRPVHAAQLPILCSHHLQCVAVWRLFRRYT